MGCFIGDFVDFGWGIKRKFKVGFIPASREQYGSVVFFLDLQGLFQQVSDNGGAIHVEGVVLK